MYYDITLRKNLETNAEILNETLRAQFLGKNISDYELNGCLERYCIDKETLLKYVERLPGNKNILKFRYGGKKLTEEKIKDLLEKNTDVKARIDSKIKFGTIYPPGDNVLFKD